MKSKVKVTIKVGGKIYSTPDCKLRVDEHGGCQFIVKNELDYWQPVKGELIEVERVIPANHNLTEAQIRHQMEMDEEEDALWDNEDGFEPCDDCDLPDACADYGCAIKQGLREPSAW